MYGSRRVTERTALTRPMDEPDYVEFASLLRTRRSRIRQFQCCVCASFIAFFTMALVVTISYSVSQDAMDDMETSPNLTSANPQILSSPSGFLKLGFPIGSGSYTLSSNTLQQPQSDAVFISDGKIHAPVTSLTAKEFKEALKAGRLAMDQRLAADTLALSFPLPSPSPESRHRHAVSTVRKVGPLALAAIGEIAATKEIEKSRSILGEASPIGSFFDGGWIPEGMCKEFQIRNCTVGKYRTFDGTCNRPLQWGSTMTPFRRSLEPNYADGIESPRKALSGNELPSAREVSLKVHKPSPSTNPSFTVMLAVYGQFLDHDITATAISQGVNGSSISCCPPSVGHPECFPVPVSSGDPVFDVAGRTCMEFVRSAPAPQCKLRPREQLNQVTAFIDGSAIYGSDIETANNLREFIGGRLRMQRTPDNRTLLPPSIDPNDGCNREIEEARGRYCFASGDPRANENLHLTTMHLLWARQHNMVAMELAKVNPTWNDEMLYQEARRIVGAQLQHITYQEFLPIVLGEVEMKLRGLKPLQIGYKTSFDDLDSTSSDPTIANNFASAAFRFAHTLLPGLMKMTNVQQGTSSYVELHRMLFNPYSLYTENGVKSSITSATQNVIQLTTTHVTSQLTNELFKDPLSNTTVPCGLDLVSLNIQRGRDHGLPGYTRWREYCGLGKVESFADLQGHVDPQVLQDVSTLYESVHDVDLYTGALAEFSKPGAIVGPTFSCLIADQFVRLQRGDRFWYETPNRPYAFMEGQLQELRKMSLARLICDCSDGVTQIQAQVMRSISPENPMVSCDDIPKLSFDAWKETSGTPMLQVPFMPFNWIDLKNNINDTILDIVNFINSTKSSITPTTTDWLAFKSRINSTFTDLRNELAGLHPAKIVETSTTTGSFVKTSKPVLQAVTPGSMYLDWISFKANLVKSLNDSLGTIGGGPAAAAKWIAFKQNIASQFIDLKNQIATAKSQVAPVMLLEKYNQEKAALSGKTKPQPMEGIGGAGVPLPAIFDWKNFKGNIINSLDSAIMNIGDNMPPPGDPAWATFGTDIMSRFSALQDELNAERNMLPMEMAAGGFPGGFAGGFAADWLAYKADIINTVNNAVKQIQDGMPPPGDPAWAMYRAQIMNNFAAFHGTPMGISTLASLSANGAPKNMKLNFPATFGANNLANLTDDWIDFRTKINDSLTRVIQDIQTKKPIMIDPVGWTIFKDTTADDFAKLKNDIATMKAEWVMEITKLKSNVSVPPTFINTMKPGDFAGIPKFDDIMKPTIPFSEWITFKQQINETVMNFLNMMNTSQKIDFDEVQASFNKSFANLKNEIDSLKEMILMNIGDSDDSKKVPMPMDNILWNKTAVDWINFRTKINSTVNDLIESLKNESKVAVGNVMKVLFDAKQKFADLNPPFTPTGNVPFADWPQYVSGINKTVTDTLNNISDLKHITLMIKASEPASSSSRSSIFFINWLLLPSLTISFQFLPISEIKEYFW